MSSYRYRKYHCGDKTILRPSYLHNGISYTGKMTSLYWNGALKLDVAIINYLITMRRTHWLSLECAAQFLQLRNGCFIYTCVRLLYRQSPSGPRFSIKMSSYQYRKSHCGDKTVARSSYLHNGISNTGKMASLYWFSPLCVLGQQSGIDL